MAERNQGMDTNMVSMQELSYMFPNVSSGMIIDTLRRHNYHREKCIEDLSLSCAGHCNVSSETSDRFGFANRSQSVSGVPGDNFNNNHQYPPPCPQSAPVISGLASPFSEISLLYQNTAEPSVSYTSTSSRFMQSAKPPVPPPTYRSSFRRDFQPGSPLTVNNFPVEQHVASLTISPVRPHHNSNWRQPFNGSRTPNPAMIGPVSQVHVNTWGLSGMKDTKPPSSGLPYQSQLHISIGSEGDCIAASKPLTPQHPNESYPPLTDSWFMPSRKYLQPGQYAQPSVSPQTSPRSWKKIPNDGYQLSLVDMEDPEQKKMTHVPLKPATSPLPKYTEPGRDFNWHRLPSREEVGNEEAYTKALIVHQKQKLSVLDREVELVRLQTEDELRELLLLEMQYFRSQVNPKHNLYFTFHDLQNLRAEVRSLMTGCSTMTLLVDLLHKGQVPLGETGEEFYRSIHTGQQGPVLSMKSNRPQPGPTRPQAVPPHLLPTTSRDTSHSRVDQSNSVTPPLPPLGKTVVSDEDDDPKWECCACTFLNNSSLVMCEMCEMPKFVQGKTTTVSTTVNSTLPSPCYCHADLKFRNCCIIEK